MLNKLTLLKKSLFLAAASTLTCAATIAATLSTPNNITPRNNQAILLVAFGTSQPGAKKAYDNIEQVISRRFPGVPLYWAYTSIFIRKKLAKQGTITYSVSEVLEQMKKKGFSNIAVQSLHVFLGAEYLEIVTAIERFKNRPDTFKQITLGMPLLNSATDIEKFYKALTAVIPKTRKSNEAIVLMGHGNGHSGIGDMTYIATGSKLQAQDKNIFVGTVEGRPSFSEVQTALVAAKTTKAYLMPMMVVAGDHACNDMAGKEADSWQSMLTQQGIKCEPILKGLGENDAMVEIFADHLQVALAALNKTKN